MQKPSLAKGTRDFGPDKTRKRKYIINTIERIFKKYQFNAIETPAIENLSVLMGKYGDEGDKLLFKIINSGDFLKKTSLDDYHGGADAMIPKISEKGLRYDLTVPFARFVVMNQNEINFPFKRYQIQPVWRADRPQKGRYREFYQCDADIVGSKSIWNEIELTLLIHEVFENLQLHDFSLKVNHREVLYTMAEFSEMQGKETEFCVELDKLDKVGFEKVLEGLTENGANSEKVKQIMEIINASSSDIDKIENLKNLTGNEEAYLEIENYLTQLKTFESKGHQFKVNIDFSLARGLSYYTGMIFEVKPTTVKMGSICGGGRYDNLTGVFGLKDVSGVGISFGLDRIYDVLDELNKFPQETSKTTDLLITHFDNKSLENGMLVLDYLRKQDINVELYPEVTKIKKQITYANKENIPFVITIGEEEIQSGLYSLKNMKTGEQTKIKLEEIPSKLG